MKAHVADCPGCGARKAFTGPAMKCSTCGSVVKAPRAKPKYRNEPTEVGGVWFQSRKEAARWVDLRLLENAGKITGLRRQTPFDLHCPGGLKVATYKADFTYLENGSLAVEDVKSEKTRRLETYRLKKRWMLLEHGIEIREI